MDDLNALVSFIHTISIKHKHALSYLKFSVESVLMHRDFTEENMVYIYMQAKWVDKLCNVKQRTKSTSLKSRRNILHLSNPLFVYRLVFRS